MQINISARHGHVKPATQEKITEKVQKLTRLFDRLTAIHVTADLENRDNLSVELRVSAEHSNDFVATDQAGELIAALDKTIHKMEQQLRKHKERITGHRATGLKHIESPADESSDEE